MSAAVTVPSLTMMTSTTGKTNRVGDCFGIDQRGKINTSWGLLWYRSDLYQSNPQLVFVLPVTSTVSKESLARDTHTLSERDTHTVSVILVP